MAVITNVPGISITVHVNGEVAQEYPPHDPTGECPSSPPSHICYIESKSNQSFLVRLTLSQERQISEANAILFTVFIDGMLAGGRILYSRPTCQLSSPINVDIKDQIIQSHVAGHCIRRSFSFSPVSLVEETTQATVERDSRRAKSLGCIVVNLATCRRGATRPLQPMVPSRNSDFVLAEKAMKGKELSHGTSYTEEILAPTPSCADAHNITPLAKYIFRYRSRAALQRELIIPQTPPPPDETFITSELGSMSDENVRFLAKEFLRVKREREVKQETPALSFKRTIDLTDDDVVEMTGRHSFKALKREGDIDVIELSD
ncbi:hypothetical protein MAC_06120 [Metarhizium acridum CQMa 102]|uniref:DUF7918 domain-containing protein n=1 Tax=Metarhizium acridum (strain CQMa 102) TaxID=655827 RepID=E9E8C2_METAQ|nr:uncharacterized protein MAC_06120 [Metarhizium acridum CQMa 102]EFY87872.1 hypothetical protein MAC_06120 [Metarhizium acridum CQMa 102]